MFACGYCPEEFETEVGLHYHHSYCDVRREALVEMELNAADMESYSIPYVPGTVTISKRGEEELQKRGIDWKGVYDVLKEHGYIDGPEALRKRRFREEHPELYEDWP